MTKTVLRAFSALLLTVVWSGSPAACQSPAQAPPQAGEMAGGRQALAGKKFIQARALFAGYLQAHPGNVDAMLGVAEADLGLHRYELSEIEFRRVVAVQPELWSAHKNLVIIEAALGRWEEFDRERALLKGARERGAAGISARESDIIDAFDVRGEHWIVRAYYVPVGRSETVYNFEQFSPEGRIVEYISLESADAAKAAMNPGGEVHIGAEGSGHAAPLSNLALNWYNGHSHGTIVAYGTDVPAYERVRADVMRWLAKRKETK